MTPADLKGLRKVTWWRVLEYASVDRLSALGAQYDKLRSYSYASILHLYHGITTDLEFQPQHGFHID